MLLQINLSFKDLYNLSVFYKQWQVRQQESNPASNICTSFDIKHSLIGIGCRDPAFTLIGETVLSYILPLCPTVTAICPFLCPAST